MAVSTVALIALVVGMGALPLLTTNPYYLQVVNIGYLTAIAVLGLNFATGITGQIVLGQAALMGTGAYTTGLLMLRYHLSWAPALLLGVVSAAAIGMVLGLVSTRIKGHYLAITTLGFNEVFRLIVLNESKVTGGPFGLRDIPQLQIPVLGTSTAQQLYFPILLVTLGLHGLAVLIYRSRYGRDMRAIRDDETAAEAMGVDSRATKIRAFTLASAMAGLAGGGYVLMVGFISPNNFTIADSIRFLVYLVVGGLGSIAGPFIASVVMVVLPEVLRGAKDYYIAIYGAAIIVVLLGFPRGLSALADRLVAPWIQRPAVAPPVPLQMELPATDDGRTS
ncbi:MAG: branched-chain amino acid ABC transporter permease [Armatimonadota bacterium]|nr:branched-chain amino acid ABC transporter permease [Armatimonadota bacterium]